MKRSLTLQAANRALSTVAACLSAVLLMLSLAIPAWATDGASKPAKAQANPSDATLRSLVVGASSHADMATADGVVEAVRQTVISAQVSGAIVHLAVKAGDRVTAGQVLLRMDARAAAQSSEASEAQAQAARASLQLATRELERQQTLFQQRYISRAALDQAEAQFKATQAQVQAQLAQLALSRTQADFNTVRSPYAGWVSELSVALGDMAMPGRPLLTVYDPSALRVTVHVPQSQALVLAGQSSPVLIELPGQAQPVQALAQQLLPTVDAGSHTVQLRLSLPPLPGLAPGMFARARLPVVSSRTAVRPSLRVPLTAVVRRAEMTGAYVLNAEGKPLLRQLRLGVIQGNQVEVLSGLSAGERLALDPQAAARSR